MSGEAPLLYDHTSDAMSRQPQYQNAEHGHHLTRINSAKTMPHDALDVKDVNGEVNGRVELSSNQAARAWPRLLWQDAHGHEKSLCMQGCYAK